MPNNSRFEYCGNPQKRGGILPVGGVVIHNISSQTSLNTELLFINIQRVGQTFRLTTPLPETPVDIFAQRLCTTCVQPFDSLCKKKTRTMSGQPTLDPQFLSAGRSGNQCEETVTHIKGSHNPPPEFRPFFKLLMGDGFYRMPRPFTGPRYGCIKHRNRRHPVSL